MNVKITLGVIVMITLVAITAVTSTLQLQVVYAIFGNNADGRAQAPPAITGDNIYVAWWTNKTGNDEVMFRASTDGGKTFGDKINLSNTPSADSTRVEIDSDVNNVVVTWWDTNQTSNVPVMRVSTDYGKTFGDTIMLSAKGPIA
jgi:hypothetical protein